MFTALVVVAAVLDRVVVGITLDDGLSKAAVEVVVKVVVALVTVLVVVEILVMEEVTETVFVTSVPWQSISSAAFAQSGSPSQIHAGSSMQPLPSPQSK